MALRNKKQYITEKYDSDKDKEKGDNRMFKRGYDVDQVTTDSKQGCLGRLTLGVLASKKTYHTVTYKLRAVTNEKAND